MEQRFNRHINDALHNVLDTHFARAIRKYEKENFYIEEIDRATTQNELNKKEQYWIQFYDSINNGYNETDAISKCGGNTYKSKTEKEMSIIKDKIRETKLGAKNPMAHKVKRTNIQTKKIDIFDTVIACARACGIKSGKTSITKRLNGQTTNPFKGIWTFEYYDK